MLTRLYIDNFRCFEKFEWKPGRKQLIIGRNGTGKTSLMDVLQNLVRVGAQGERVDQCFKSNERTRWLDQPGQVFEIEAQLENGNYFYKLVIEPRGEPARQQVQREVLRHNNAPIVDVCNAEALNLSPVPSFQLDRSALSTSVKPGLSPFREWLSKISCWHINPVSMGSRVEGEDPTARADLANFAAWYRHLVLAFPTENSAFLEDLRASLDGFHHFVLDSGDGIRILHAEFLRDGRSIRIPFDGLSDGQRCLICLYAILHFAIAKGGTVIIDEPDNFVSLREIQPWLTRIEDIADDHNGQVILISHHPEILNQWANPYGVEFVCDGAGPVRAEKFRGDPEGALTAAEVVAEGWDFD